jgi:hypothetical protein
MSIRYKHLQPLHDDIQRTGLVEANMLALVRYATNDGYEYGDCVVLGDGERWWPVSYNEIGALLNLGRHAAIRLVQKLEADKELLGCIPDASKGDQTKAYRLPEPHLSSRVHQRTSGEQQSSVSGTVLVPGGHGTGSQTDSLPLSLEREEKKKRARERASEPANLRAVPDPGNANKKNPSQKQEQEHAPNGASLEEETDDPRKPRPQLGWMIHRLLKATNIEQAGNPPPRRDTHTDTGTEHIDLDPWVQRQRGIGACTLCDASGYLDDGARCWHGKATANE